MSEKTSKNAARLHRDYETRTDELVEFCRLHGRRPSTHAPDGVERSLADWLRDRKEMTPRLAQLLEMHPATPRGQRVFSTRDARFLERRLHELEHYCQIWGHLPSSSSPNTVEGNLARWALRRGRQDFVPPRLTVLLEKYPTYAEYYARETVTPVDQKPLSARSAQLLEARMDELENFCEYWGHLPSTHSSRKLEASLGRWVKKWHRADPVPPRLAELLKCYPTYVEYYAPEMKSR